MHCVNSVIGSVALLLRVRLLQLTTQILQLFVTCRGGGGVNCVRVVLLDACAPLLLTCHCCSHRYVVAGPVSMIWLYCSPAQRYMSSSVMVSCSCG